MAKIYGLFGSMTGKLAETVMSVRNGEQIARKYQPVVYNPSTPAQVAQRAKLKLMSQLSAVLGNTIAIPRRGSVSSRNLFTKKNIGKAIFENNNADIDFVELDITGSAVGLSPVTAQFNANGNIDLQLSLGDTSISRVVYIVLSVQNDNSIRIGSTSVVNTPGDRNEFPTEAEGNYTPDSYVLAYGVRDNTDAARTIFGNLTSPDALDIARIITTRSLTEKDITLTETRGVKVTPVSASHSVENPDTRKAKK